jgi:hypothetical protein
MRLDTLWISEESRIATFKLVAEVREVQINI